MADLVIPLPESRDGRRQMQDAFEQIARARAILKERPAHAYVVAGKTAADYVATVKRLIAGQATAEQVINRASETTSPRTWYKRRAALLYVFAAKLEQLLRQQDQLQHENKIDPDEFREKIRQIKLCADLIERIPKTCPLKTRTPRRSKRGDLARLPADWRERLIARMPKYRMQMLVAAVTGCRPAELVMGVELQVQGESLVAVIKGAKVSENAGQKVRILTFYIASSSLTTALAAALGEGRHMVNIADAKQFSGAVRAAAKREWPLLKRTITPYCLRHQSAADWKADPSMTDDDVSLALGHATNKFKTQYGQAKQARKNGKGPMVTATRDIKHTHTVFPPLRAALPDRVL